MANKALIHLLVIFFLALSHIFFFPSHASSKIFISLKIVFYVFTSYVLTYIIYILYVYRTWEFDGEAKNCSTSTRYTNG